MDARHRHDAHSQPALLEPGRPRPRPHRPRLRAASSGKLIFGAPSQLYLTLSVARPNGVLASLDIRKALFMTINRAELAKAAYYGAAIPNYTQMNIGSWKKATYTVSRGGVRAGH